MSNPAILTIQAYRRILSPHKGFRCAHHAIYRKGSCSDFGLRVFKVHQFVVGVLLMARRFAECRAAMVSQSPNNDERSRRELFKHKEWRIAECGCVACFPAF
jgi:uncharacterized protein